MKDILCRHCRWCDLSRANSSKRASPEVLAPCGWPRQDAPIPAALKVCRDPMIFVDEVRDCEMWVKAY